MSFISKITDFNEIPIENKELNGFGVMGYSSVRSMDNAFRELMACIARVNAGTDPVADTWTFGSAAGLTSRMRFNAGRIAPGATRIITAPDEDLALFNAVGAVFDFAGTSAPLGFLMCYGQAVSRSTYSGLWSVIGATYGSGDGSTTFNVPDLRGRVVAGKDDMGGTSANRLTNQSGGLNGDVLGATGGTETHTLTTAQLAAHSHGVNDPAHAHGINDPGHHHQQTGGNAYPAGSDYSAANTLNHMYTGYTSANYTGVTVAGAYTGISIQNAGSGSAHNNVQPTAVLNKIIFAGV